eukprot:589067-Ditylum_brightwellii.AAC.1
MAFRQRRNHERIRQQRTATVTTTAVLISVYAAVAATHQDELSSSDEEEDYAGVPFIGFDSGGGGGKMPAQPTSNKNKSNSLSNGLHLRNNQLTEEFLIDSCSVGVIEEENVDVIPTETEREEEFIVEQGNFNNAEATNDRCFEKINRGVQPCTKIEHEQ